MNSAQPKVSVLIPAYNHEQFVETSIRSVLSQSYANIDLLVVDDGSSDKTKEIVQNLLDQEKSFRFQTQENKGLIDTINHYLKSEPLGKYVCILASDDYWPLQKVEQQVLAMEAQPNCHLSYGDYTEVDNNNKTLEFVQCDPPEKDTFEELLLSNYIPAPTTMMRSSVFEKVGYFSKDYKIEDWYMWLKISKSYPSHAYVRANLAFYRLHPNNSHKNIELMTKESFKILELYKDSVNYKKALSLVKVKDIVKSFFLSKNLGFQSLKKNFSVLDLFCLLQIFLQKKGPFRKLKRGYLNFMKSYKY